MSEQLSEEAALKRAQYVQLCETEEDYARLMAAAYMEAYIDQIRDCTFGWTFRDFPALVHYHENPVLSWRENADLLQLAEVIDEAKRTMNWSGIFVRLSSRSPKDAAMHSPKFGAIYHERFAILESEEVEIPQATAANRQLQAIYYASTWALSVTSGAEAVDLLVKSNRIQGDLSEYLAGKISVPFQICVREFRKFHPEFEFRGFVHKNKFTALTQYNDLCWFPFLERHQEKVLSQIQRDFANIMPNIPQSSYTVDFVLAPAEEGNLAEGSAKYENLKVFVIEINPLAEFAGSGLFDWTKARDKAVLLGFLPFEFRMATKPPSFASQNLSAEWQDALKVAQITLL